MLIAHESAVTTDVFQTTVIEDITEILFAEDVMSESSEYQPIACGLHDRLEALATTGGIVQIVARTSDGGRLALEDRLVDVFARGGEEFVRTGRGELIRLDHLESVDGVTFQSDAAPQSKEGSEGCARHRGNSV